jgi:hypothetical protein
VTALAAYIREMQERRDPDYKARYKEAVAVLAEIVTPPLRLSDKKEALERARVLLEGWCEV